MTEIWLLLVPLREAFVVEIWARWLLLASKELSLECPQILIIAKMAGKCIASSNYQMAEQFLSLFLLEVKKPHCLHNIPKLRFTAKAQVTSVHILAILTLTKVQAHVRAHSSACWAEVAVRKGCLDIRRSCHMFVLVTFRTRVLCEPWDISATSRDSL